MEKEIEEKRIRKCIKRQWEGDFELVHFHAIFPDYIDVTVKLNQRVSPGKDWIKCYRDGGFKIFEGLKDLYEDVEVEVKFREPKKNRSVSEEKEKGKDTKPLAFRVNFSSWKIAERVETDSE